MSPPTPQPSRALAMGVFAGGLALLVSSAAGAQEVNYQDPSGINHLPTKGETSGDGGFLVGEGVMMHAGLGAEAGYDSNVFYNDAERIGSPILRINPFLEFTNVLRGGHTPVGGEFDFAANLLYREYLSSEESVKKQRAFNPTIYGSVGLHPGQQVTFALSDTFSREEMPPYGPAQLPFQRTTNQGVASLRFAPGGGRIQGTLQYLNRIDMFAESDAMRRNNMLNEGMLDLAWLWFPKTAVYLRARQGMQSYFNAGPSGSYPLHVLLGLRGLITAKLSTNISAGYANAFYSSGTSTVGVWGSTAVDVQFTYTPGPTTQVAAGYHHDFQNALIGNFYYMDSVFLGVRQLIGGRLAVVASVRYDLRNYQGPDTNDTAMGMEITRHDNLLQAGATLDYGLRHGFYLGVGYSANILATDYQLGSKPLDYGKHQVFGRAGVAY